MSFCFYITLFSVPQYMPFSVIVAPSWLYSTNSRKKSIGLFILAYSFLDTIDISRLILHAVSFPVELLALQPTSGSHPEVSQKHFELYLVKNWCWLWVIHKPGAKDEECFRLKSVRTNKKADGEVDGRRESGELKKATPLYTYLT